MDDNEANYLRQCIRELEQANRRWKAVAFSLLVLLTILIILGGVGLIGVATTQRARAERMAAEEARREAERAALQAQQARLAAQAAEQPQANPDDEQAKGGCKSHGLQRLSHRRAKRRGNRDCGTRQRVFANWPENSCMLWAQVAFNANCKLQNAK